MRAVVSSGRGPFLVPVFNGYEMVLMHMWPCAQMQVHFYRLKYLHGGHKSSRSTLTLQCRCQLVCSIREKLQLGLEMAILVMFVRLLKLLEHLKVH